MNLSASMRAVASMENRLTLKITDGGAKTEEQRECLREVDPDGAQGFLVSREQRPSC